MVILHEKSSCWNVGSQDKLAKLTVWNWANFMAVLLVFFSLNAINAQRFVQNGLGIFAGVQWSFGTHEHSLGLKLNGYYQNSFFQVNAGEQLTYHFYDLGNRRGFWQSRTGVGALLLAGKQNRTLDFEFDVLNHQSNHNLGVGFAYLWYYDQVQTSQLSGAWSLHVGEFAAKFENDVFGGQAKDRFRTGHLLVQYQIEQQKIGLGLKIWTGETKGSVWIKEVREKCPSGYRYLEDLPYGKTSHGILYLGYTLQMPAGNTAFWRVGYDSEQVRHIFQNRLTHDLLFLPKKFERNTPHYPRLDEHGCAVFNKEDMKEPVVFMQFGFNE